MTDANPLRAVPDAAGPVDRDRIEKAVREILFAIGEDPDRDGLVRTPARVAEMYAEICAGLSEDPARHLVVTFEADHDEMVLVRDIALYCDLRAPPHPVPRARARRVHPGRRRAHHRPVEAGAPRRRVRQAPAGAGAAHDADRRRARRRARATRRVRDDRGRAPLHVDARRAQAGNAHRHVGRARVCSRRTRRPGPRSCRCSARFGGRI